MEVPVGRETGSNSGAADGVVGRIGAAMTGAIASTISNAGLRIMGGALPTDGIDSAMGVREQQDGQMDLMEAGGTLGVKPP